MDVEDGRQSGAQARIPTPTQVLEQQQQLIASTHQLIFALVILFFIFGMLPTQFVMWIFLAVLLAMMWQRWTASNRAVAQLQEAGQLDVAELQQQLFLSNPLLFIASGGQVDIQNLRLSLMNRDFNEQDYEMLLALDQQITGPQRPVSDEEIARLPLHKIKVIDDCSNDKEIVKDRSWNENTEKGRSSQQMCAICFETYMDKEEVIPLACSHVFHEKCIVPWLKQNGARATCPVCKALVFKGEVGTSGGDNSGEQATST